MDKQSLRSQSDLKPNLEKDEAKLPVRNSKKLLVDTLTKLYQNCHAELVSASI